MSDPLFHTRLNPEKSINDTMPILQNLGNGPREHVALQNVIDHCLCEQTYTDAAVGHGVPHSYGYIKRFCRDGYVGSNDFSNDIAIWGTWSNDPCYNDHVPARTDRHYFALVFGHRGSFQARLRMHKH